MAEADSPAHRRRLSSSFQSEIQPPEPGAGRLVIGTRFNELDIIGELLTEPGWVHINVPAVSEAGVPDALNRKPGVAMISALGRTAEGFAEIERAVGQRAWAALYLGVPSAPEGGLIHRAWLDDWRLDVAPPRPVATCVAVDPSDSGQGDAAGVVACSMTDDGVVCLIADRSRPMTSDEWGREAVALAYAVGASQIAVEGYTTAETYARVVKAALDGTAVLIDAHPVRVRTWRGKGDALARSAPLLQAMETGRFRLAGTHPTWEQAAVQWQAGQHQSDQVAATVIAFDSLISAAGMQMTLAAPLAGALGDRATVTSITGFLSRRVDGTNRPALSGPWGAGEPALARRIPRR